MSHFKNVCPHGITVSQCRCTALDKEIHKVPCPMPGSHAHLKTVTGDGMATQGPGAWVAMHSDKSAVVIFGDELSALRYAMENTMSLVKFVAFGEEV